MHQGIPWMNADLTIDSACAVEVESRRIVLDVEIRRIGCNSLNIARAPATTACKLMSSLRSILPYLQGCPLSKLSSLKGVLSCIRQVTPKSLVPSHYQKIAGWAGSMRHLKGTFVLTMFYTCTHGEGRHDLSINENPIALPFSLWESNGSTSILWQAEAFVQCET